MVKIKLLAFTFEILKKMYEKAGGASCLCAWDWSQAIKKLQRGDSVKWRVKDSLLIMQPFRSSQGEQFLHFRIENEGNIELAKKATEAIDRLLKESGLAVVAN